MYISQLTHTQRAECSLIIETGYRVDVFSQTLDSSAGLWVGIQSAGALVSKTSKVRILHSAEEDRLSPSDLKLACLCQSIQINYTTHKIINIIHGPLSSTMIIPLCFAVVYGYQMHPVTTRKSRTCTCIAFNQSNIKLEMLAVLWIFQILFSNCYS